MWSDDLTLAIRQGQEDLRLGRLLARIRIVMKCGKINLGFSLFGMYKISYAKRKKEDSLVCDGENDAEEVVYTGKRKALKVFNEKMDYLFISPEQRAQEKAKRDALNELTEEYSQEKKEVFLSMRQEENETVKKKNSRGIIFSFVIVLAIWIINTISGY